MSSPTDHLLEAIALARDNVRRGGRPFGAVVVKDGNVIARGVNEILATNDPTAHAELLALRAAGRALGTPRLDGCSVYASGHPCPMCLAAMRMAGIKEVAFAYSNEEGEPYGLSTAAIYAELAKPLAQQAMKMVHLPVRPEGETELYELWRASLST
ncbi:nucleoside deaminase [Archangium lansingense]|uniref:Nucleoside deaminase n=1 Tax=Archangium lansingense TaxID=2995310 RepID=A0ABT4AG96_9BACT|nr:nucleoside deaminase [Archangium lansinium]MCY1080708.1 nucleoside deaminase [Archangium lansinium]